MSFHFGMKSSQLLTALSQKQAYLNFTYFELATSSADLFFPRFRAVTSLLSLAASIFQKSSSVSSRIWLAWTACWILFTGPLAPSLSELVPSTYYNSPSRIENNSAFKIMNMPSIFTDSSFIALMEVWSWPLTSNKCWGQEYMDLHISSPICLHHVVLY